MTIRSAGIPNCIELPRTTSNVLPVSGIHFKTSFLLINEEKQIPMISNYLTPEQNVFKFSGIGIRSSNIKEKLHKTLLSTYSGIL